MVMTPTMAATAGQLLTKINPIQKAIFGGGEKKPLHPQEQIKIQTIADRKAFREKMRLAEEFKIHPLTMLGAQMPQGASVYTDTGASSNMGQNISSVIAKGASSYFTGKSNKALNDLQLERAQLENDLLRSQKTNIDTQTAQLGGQHDVVTPPLAPKYKYKGDEIPVAMDEMGEGSQLYFDITSIVPKMMMADAKSYINRQFRENKNLFMRKDGKLRATPALLQKLKNWALANQKR